MQHPVIKYGMCECNVWPIVTLNYYGPQGSGRCGRCRSAVNYLEFSSREEANKLFISIHDKLPWHETLIDRDGSDD